MRRWLSIDLETVPIPDCAAYLTDISAPSNYKDPDKIRAFIANTQATLVRKAGCDLDLCEIVAIGLKDSRYGNVVVTRAEESETDMVAATWDTVREVTRDGGILVGFNCLAFDFPVLARRSLYLGVPAVPLRVDKYRHDGILDLQHELTYGGRMPWRSLAFYCRRFGIPYDETVSGDDIAGLVVDSNWTAVGDHVLQDAVSTALLAERCGFLPTVAAV